MTDAEAQEVLSGTWHAVNRVLMAVTDETVCKALLQSELEHQKRGYLAMRIYHRYNRLRAKREQSEIVAITGTYVGALYGTSKTSKSEPVRA